MKFGFLGTRVGRRFLAVNLLTALLPVAAITAVSFFSLRAELRDQAEARVTRLGKSAGMTALTFLSSMSLTLAGAGDSSSVKSSFIANGIADAAQSGTIAGGIFGSLTPEQVAHLRTGRPLLLIAPASRDTAIVLVHAELPWTSTVRPITWGHVRPAALFSEIDETVDGERAALCIIEASTLRRIHCSEGVTPEVEAKARTHASRDSTGRAANEASNLFIASRDVYLRHEYGTPEWTVIVMQSSAATFAGAAAFRNNFLLLSIGILVLIFMVSHAQIRRTTEPLERLGEATRRLGAGDFGTPVVVTSKDEFEEVADSFNSMASSLHRQLTLMRHLDAVDQSALGARDNIAVVSEALATLSDSVVSIAVTVAIADPASPLSMVVTTRQTATGAQRTGSLDIPHAERDELLRHPRQLLLHGANASRTYHDGTRGAGALVMPLVKDMELLGFVAVHRPPIAAADTDTCWTEVRRLADRVALALSNVQLVTRLEALSAGTVLAFARAIDANSPWTAGHSERVTRVAVEIGRELQLTEAELDTLQRGGLLHDIGKIAVPPAVLDKVGRLSDEEWELMRRHPVVGCEILSPIPAFADALPIVRSHHERMDGTGYPDQLYGEAIPFLARVLAVADVFDALASDRPYRAGMTTAGACDIIQRGSGTHFDPRVVHAFMDAVHAGRIQTMIPARESAVLAASVARARVPVTQPA